MTAWLHVRMIKIFSRKAAKETQGSQVIFQSSSFALFISRQTRNDGEIPKHKRQISNSKLQTRNSKHFCLASRVLRFAFSKL